MLKTENPEVENIMEPSFPKFSVREHAYMVKRTTC